MAKYWKLIAALGIMFFISVAAVYFLSKPSDAELEQQRQIKLGDTLARLLKQNATVEEVAAAFGNDWKPVSVSHKDDRLIWKMEPVSANEGMSTLVVFLEFDAKSKILVKKWSYSVN